MRELTAFYIGVSLLIIVYSALAVWNGRFTGKRMMPVRRDDQPFQFWLGIFGMNALAIMVLATLFMFRWLSN